MPTTATQTAATATTGDIVFQVEGTMLRVINRSTRNFYLLLAKRKTSTTPQPVLLTYGNGEAKVALDGLTELTACLVTPTEKFQDLVSRKCNGFDDCPLPPPPDPFTTEQWEAALVGPQGTPQGAIGAKLPRTIPGTTKKPGGKR